MGDRDAPQSFGLWLLADKDTGTGSVHVGVVVGRVGYCLCIVTYSCQMENEQWTYYIPHWHVTRDRDSGHITYRTGMRHVIETVGILHTALA